MSLHFVKYPEYKKLNTEESAHDYFEGVFQPDADTGYEGGDAPAGCVRSTLHTAKRLKLGVVWPDFDLRTFTQTCLPHLMPSTESFVLPPFHPTRLILRAPRNGDIH